MLEPGISSLLPTLVVLISAVLLKRALEALIIGALVGFIMLQEHLFMAGFLNAVLQSMNNETVSWIVLTVAMFGSIITLLVKSGSANAFASSLTRYIKTGPQALLATWGLGLLIFLDDYLNALAVGSAMKKVTDKLKVSREMLAYVVDTTAAPVCILLPFSTWAIYVSGLLESNNVAAVGQGIHAYIGAIPYMLYAWVALLMPPLLATGKLPLLGGMRKAQARAQAGQSKPSGFIDAQDEHAEGGAAKGRFMHFVVPMLALIGFTWLFDIDILKGAFATLVLIIAMYSLQGLMKLHEIFDHCMTGVKSMVEVIAILIMSFVLKDVNDQLQLTPYVIDIATSWVNPLLLPLITFLALAIVAFATGTFWGLYAVALPVVIPLANTMGVDVYLMIGAVISAGAFGSHACFYSDSTILSAQGSGCPPMNHALTQLPYALMAASITAVGFLLLAWL
ncbi:sodium:proton antiporter [Dasania sp. GY-MA-18]|uniref:Sodium:proton antiporter n=1 Tax=Dasania phycosphaerae TaxID=2950436 RepID=A0A9J6RQ62_9GAMM|nr:MULTISPECIES: Na+/H+ antiporter NhaC family protein [Dasania]MCR8924071.1 sodium:proton antiporter [Dasania sp. GY-MA-18]MCZ0866644.1 sodium:proton antiporter [Dasania phycosphaerae]MCZ0870229.1 sodium:proton antiporter [Dasania phycosphaerae]